MNRTVTRIRLAQGTALIGAWATLATLASVSSSTEVQARPKLWSATSSTGCAAPHGSCAMARMR